MCIRDSGKEEESSSISSSVSESQSSSSQSSSSQSVAQKVSVPNFVGETYQDIIDSDNYTEMFLFTTEYEYSDDYDEGKIIRQEPAFGNKVSPGATIKLYVSKGPEYATIPTNIVGLSKGDAQQVLSELNVLFEIVEVENPGGTYKAYTVVKTEPEAGQKVKMNETVVKLYVAKEATPASSESTPESSSSQPTTETQMCIRDSSNNLFWKTRCAFVRTILRKWSLICSWLYCGWNWSRGQTLYWWLCWLRCV